MADFASDVASLADTFRTAASDLDNLVRQVGWAMQDALETGAALPRPESPHVSPQVLALEYAARTLGPTELRKIMDHLDGGRATLDRLLATVLPPEATAAKPPRGRKAGGRVERKPRRAKP